jgi:hypothetical protein
MSGWESSTWPEEHEFASGAEGVGAGSGGIGILYNINSLGEGPAASRSNVEAVYRKIVGMPGGL